MDLYQNQHIYIASSYFLVLIILGYILIQALCELKSLKNEKKDNHVVWPSDEIRAIVLFVPFPPGVGQADRTGSGKLQQFQGQPAAYRVFQRGNTG